MKEHIEDHAPKSQLSQYINSQNGTDYSSPRKKKKITLKQKEKEKEESNLICPVVDRTEENCWEKNTQNDKDSITDWHIETVENEMIAPSQIYDKKR